MTGGSYTSIGFNGTNTLTFPQIRAAFTTVEDTPDVHTLAELAAFSDSSVANLSSIVVLAECGGKTMMLTGDARGDDIISGVTRPTFERK